MEDERGLDTHLRCIRENGVPFNFLSFWWTLKEINDSHVWRAHGALGVWKCNVKVMQPGLVYVIEWASGTNPSSPTFPSPPTSDRKLRSDDKHASTSSSHRFDDEDGQRSTVYVV